MATKFRILNAGGWGNCPIPQAGMRFEPGVEAVAGSTVGPSLPLTVTGVSVRSGLFIFDPLQPAPTSLVQLPQ